MLVDPPSVQPKFKDKRTLTDTKIKKCNHPPTPLLISKALEMKPDILETGNLEHGIFITYSTKNL